MYVFTFLNFIFRDLDEGLEEPIASIIWAAFRLQADVPELRVVVDQLRRKYGKEFVESCQRNEMNNVNEKVMHKLGVEAPPKKLVEMYMEEIAKSYNIPFTPDPGVMIADETLTVDNLLLDVEINDKKGGGGGGGGGGGMAVMNPGAPPPPAGFVDTMPAVS